MTERLPRITAAEVIRALERAGFSWSGRVGVTRSTKTVKEPVTSTLGLTMADEKIHAVIVKEREDRPYADLWHASNVLEALATEDPRGSTWKFMSALILSAFAWEAYLNQVGAQIDPQWNTVERKLSPKEKLKHIAKTIGKNIDLGASPYQEIKELHDLRDKLAHPKPNNLRAVEVVFETPDVIEELIAQRPPTDWEPLCTESEVKRLRNAVKAAILDLHQTASVNHPAFTHGMSTTSASIKSEP